MRILLIRPGAIGDSLLTFPVLQALRTHHKEAHITLVSNPAVLPLAQAYHLADAVFDYGSALWSQLFLPPHKYTQGFRALLQQTDEAICWLRDDSGIVEQSLHTVGIQRVLIAPGRPPTGKPIHIVDYLLQTISLQPAPSLAYNGLALPYGNEGPPNDNVPIAIHPGSGGISKCWPVPSFIALIETLLQRPLPILLLGGPADHDRIQQIQQHILHSNPTKHRELLTTLIDAPLLTVAQHLQQCRGYLGNDSGITHLAALLGVPTLALFGPSDPLIWHPIGPHVSILHKPDLQHLSSHTVMNTLTSFILS